MDNQKKTFLPPYVMLMLVAIVMSFAISGVYLVTKDRIEAAAAQAQYEARAAVMPDASEMEELPLEENAPVDACFAAYDDAGGLMGYVSQVTVIGFGGEIEVTVGMDMDGAITAISVGGQSFSETSGLGARTREPAFTEQFSGKSGTLVLKKDIDSVTGASVSSGAVVSGVNKALRYMTELLPAGTAEDGEEPPLTEEMLEALLPGAENVRYMGGGTGIDGWWQADDGYIVRATGFGEGPIAVTVGFDGDGAVAGLEIGDENFMETEGRGDGVLADWYREQFIGRSGLQAYGDGLDAISGATVTSNATLAAINACMTFDPSEPDAEAESAAIPAEEPEPADAETSATETEPAAEEEAPTEEPAPAIAEEPEPADAETSATEAEPAAEEEAPTEEPVPAVTEESEPADAETSATEAEPAAEEKAPTEEPAPAATEEPGPADAETSATEAEPAAEEEAPTEEPAPAVTEEPASEEQTASSEEPGTASGEPDAAAGATAAAETPEPTPDAVTEASVTD